MKYTTAIIAASAAAANAQFTINPDGSFTCNSTATANFCVSDSLGTPIIMHCVDGVGEAGNCSDELAGEPPFDVTFGECWQTSATSGDAACEKNCVVYPVNGSPFTLPAALCTPSETTTSSSTSTATSLSSTITPLSSSATSLTGSTTTTSTRTSVHILAGVTVTETFTTTWCPESTLSTVILPSSGASILYPSNGTTIAAGTGTGSGSGSGAAVTGTGSSPTGSGSGASSNGTVTSASGGKGGSGSSPTATPVGPKTTASPAPSTFTGAATTKSASAALAVIGLAIAYFL